MEDFSDDPGQTCGIKHDGNFFILDSEPLVNNPYQQLQQDAANDYQKKTTLTEKCTSVKNNVCENHFIMTKSMLDRQMNKHLRQIHEDTSRLRYEVKLLDLNKRKYEMEFKKRLDPSRDFSYDDTQLSKTEKRLGVNIESHYLDKKLRYPVRGKMTGELIITPIVAKARHSLKEQKMMKKTETERQRVLTAKSLTSSYNSSVFHGNHQQGRLASRSAPLTTTKNFSATRETAENQSRFPDIQGSLDGGGTRQGPPTKVKFAFGNPMKILLHSDSNPDYILRSHTFHGLRHHLSNSSDEDSDSDSKSSQHIDLRALLFGKSESSGLDRDNMSIKSHPASSTMTHPPIIRRGGGSHIPQQQTQEKLRKEAKQIQEKVVTFLNQLETDPLLKPKKKEEFCDDEELIEDPNNTTGYVLQKSKKLEVAAKTKPKTSEKKQEMPEEESEKIEESEQERKKINPKETWKLIRGHAEGGHLRGTYTPSDLVMQQLTGILLVGGKKGHIPMNAASRALRHTATFKMRKVVEQLIESRTRFQQHEVDELKKKIEGEENSKLPPESCEVVETVA